MLDTIKSYESSKTAEVKHTSFVKSDDGTIVFFKDKYDPETGEKLSDEVVETVSIFDIEKEIETKQNEITTLQGFLDEVK